MMPAPYSSYLLIAAALLATVIILRSSRRLMRVLIKYIMRPVARRLAAVGRALWRPIYRIVVRPITTRVRRIAKGGAGVTAPTQRSVQVGAGGATLKALVRRVLEGSTAEAALGEVPEHVKDNVETKWKWLPFRLVNANQAGVGLHEAMSIEDARVNVELAQKYYERTIDDERVNSAILYEDSEETLIIELLRDGDVGFFWVLLQFRKHVDRNIVYLLALTLIFLAFSSFAVGMLPDLMQKLWAFGAFVFVVLVLRLLYYFSSVYNGSHLYLFVQTYFSRLSNQYRSAATAFSNIMNDRTATLDVIEKNANIWFVNLHWMSARQWLLDLYMRNCRYQIKRDMWWRRLAVPIAFGAALAFSVTVIEYVMARYFGMSVSLSSNWDGWSTTLVFAMALVSFSSWIGLQQAFWNEVTTASWPTFGTMDIKELIERFIGPTVREVVDKRRNPYGGAPAPH